MGHLKSVNNLTPDELAEQLNVILGNGMIESVKTGTEGDQTPVLIVTLRKQPPSCFDPKTREFGGLEVLWKVKDKVEAL
jgi:hypothetical protein